MNANPTFDTHKEIESWKSALKTSGNFDEESLLELESHLQDEIEALAGNNLSDEERFLVAQHRIGSEHVLSKAYKQTSRFNFQKISWFAQAFIFMSMFIVLSRMVRFAIVEISFLGQLENQFVFLSVYLFLQIIASAIVYFTYKWVQKKPTIVKANTTAILSLITVIIAYLIQTSFFSSRTLSLNSSFIGLIWGAMSYVLVFIWFVVINVKQIKKLRSITNT